MRKLPELLQLISDELSFKQALEFVAEFGGQEVYIPKKINKNSVLYDRVEIEILELLIYYYGGDKIVVPIFNASMQKITRNNIIKDIKAGKTVNEIVKNNGVARDTVYKIKRSIDAENECEQLLIMFDKTN